MKKIFIILGLILVISASVYDVYFYAYKGKGQDYNKNSQTSSRTAISTSITVSPTQSITATPTITPTPTLTENTCNDLLVLVDRTYGLPSDYAPSDLVYLSKYNIPVTSSSLQARSILISDLEKLFNDAKSAGINLVVDSPYRSYAVQSSVYNSYVAQYGKASADQFSAQPGHSQHQLGTAVDFSTSSLNDKLDQSFANTPAGVWLNANAYKYGFYISYPYGKESITGYEYEPWHFRYIGVQNALALKNSGIDMETYLQKNGVKPNCQ